MSLKVILADDHPLVLVGGALALRPRISTWWGKLSPRTSFWPCSATAHVMS